MKLTSLLLWGILFSYLAFAQTDSRIASSMLPIESVERIDLPALNNKTLREAELNRRGPGVVPRFAESVPLSLNPQTHGNWETLKNGNRLWRLRIRSEQAHSLNLGFTDYYMPAGGTLILYSRDQQAVLGPFSPADNETHGQLWTPIVPGNEIVIEVQLPAAVQNQLLLQLAYVNHDFMDFASVLSGSCNLDVVCGQADGYGIVDGYRDIIRSVGVYYRNGNSICTGFLVNNTANDCRPFFMTADHCGMSPGNASSIVVYWNYENSVCRQPNSPQSGSAGNGQLTQFNTGSVFRAGWSTSDFTLLELDDEVNPEFQPYFAGWDATNGPTGDSVICVHHPGTEEKRISFEFDATAIGDDNGNPNSNQNYVIVSDWDIGTTEGGSSGSPLFNKQKRVIGQLFGGLASCSNNAYDVFGWFHRSWTGGGTANTRLSNWLDPGNTALLSIGGRDCGQAILAEEEAVAVCSPADAIFYLQVTEGFSDSVQLSLVGLPSAALFQFSQNPVAPGDTLSLVITNLAVLFAGNYDFVVSGTDGIETVDAMLSLQINLNPPDVLQILPADGETGVSPNPDLSWLEEPLTQYEVELATDSMFTNIVALAGISSGSWEPGTLEEESTYYWRVRGTNSCGMGNYSNIWSFTTGALFCESAPSTNVPVSISANFPSNNSSTLQVSTSGIISDLNLTNLNILHTWVGDLTLTLTSPQGTSVVLLDQIDCDNNNIAAEFDDQAPMTYADLSANCPFGNPAINGSFQPLQSLSAFNGEQVQGSWTLTVEDGFFGDGGSLQSWSLKACFTVAQSLITSPGEISVCAGTDTSFHVQVGDAFNPMTGMVVTVNNLPPGATYIASPIPAQPNSVVNVDLQQLTVPGQYLLDISGTDGPTSRSTQLILEVLDTPQATLLLPLDGASQQPLDPVMYWETNVSADSFRIEIATDSNFSNIVQTQRSSSDSVGLDSLNTATYYYWRVVAYNNCGSSVSGVQWFATAWATSLEGVYGVHISLFPNPTRQQSLLLLSAPIADNLHWELISLTGQRLQNGEINSGVVQQMVTLEELPEGLYLFRLSGGEGSWTERLWVR